MNNFLIALLNYTPCMDDISKLFHENSLVNGLFLVMPFYGKTLTYVNINSQLDAAAAAAAIIIIITIIILVTSRQHHLCFIPQAVNTV